MTRFTFKKHTTFFKILGIAGIIIPLLYSSWIFITLMYALAYGHSQLLTPLPLLAIAGVYIWSVVSLILGKARWWSIGVTTLVLGFMLFQFLPPTLDELRYYFSREHKADEFRAKGDVKGLEKTLSDIAKTPSDEDSKLKADFELKQIQYGTSNPPSAPKPAPEGGEKSSQAEPVNPIEDNILVYIQQGDMASATQLCNRLITNKSYVEWGIPGEGYLICGNVLYDFQQYDKAAEDYSQAIGIAEKTSQKPCVTNQAHLARANAYARLGQEKSALDDYQFVIEHPVPKEFGQDEDEKRCGPLSGYLYRAEYYILIKSWLEAYKDLQTILNEKTFSWSVDVEAHMLMGYIMELQGNQEAASEHYTKAEKMSMEWDDRGAHGQQARISKTLTKLTGYTYIPKVQEAADRKSLKDTEMRLQSDKEMLENVPSLLGDSNFQNSNGLNSK